MAKRLFFTIFFLFLGFVVCYSEEDCKEGTEPQEEFDTLPIFKAEPITIDKSGVGKLSQDLTGQEIPLADVKSGDGKFFINFGSSVIEVYSNTGGIWFADKAQMWNPDLNPVLSATESVRSIANELFNKIYGRQIHDSNSPLIASFSNIGKTLSAEYDVKTQTRTDKQLDIQVNYDTKVKVKPLHGEPVLLPVVGGGNEFNFTFGHKGKLISHSGVWREVQKDSAKQAKVIPKDEADKEFKKLLGEVELISFTSYLAYYSGPPFLEQKFLYPVYVYDPSIKIHNKIIEGKIILLPATEFGPPMKGGTNSPTSSETEDPRSDDAAADADLIRPGSTDAEGDDTAEGAREVGIDWITSGGIPKSGDNAKGFLNEMKSAGWIQNFDWGDPNAFERDWNAHDDMWVDAADFVYYSGHADKSSWTLSWPKNFAMTCSPVGSQPETPGDLWGEQDLEWIIIDACGPLYDHRLHNNLPSGYPQYCDSMSSVFKRWSGIFDGLHQLLGFAAKIPDNDLTGPKVAQYMKQGDNIIDAWFRTAREVHNACNSHIPPDGPKIWAAVIYAKRNSPGGNPRNDHLWSVGSVASDPRPPDVIVAMWTTT